jgi:periplasmic divalent cation tolerance protein
MRAAAHPYMESPKAMNSVLITFCTCPDSASAEAIAHALVQERLAACVNRVPGIASTYRWEGKVTTDREELLLIKTTAGRFEAMKERLLQLHPYDLPEVLALATGPAHEAYVDWVRASVADSV